MSQAGILSVSGGILPPSVALTYTTDSGVAVPAANNLNEFGSGSITTTGSGSTITTELTGLTNHSVLIGAGTSTITKVGPVASTGAVLQSNGLSSDPGFSTATYPSVTTVNEILYSSATNTVTGLATANMAVLATDGSGVPSITATPTVTSITFGSGTALSSYVEGTWVPTFTASGTQPTSIGYSAQNGTYVRIGNTVTVWCHLAVNAYTVGAPTGNLQISGLPFTSNAAQPASIGNIVWDNLDTALNTLQVSAFIAINSNIVDFPQSFDFTISGPRVSMSIFALQISTVVDLQITYRV